MAQPSTIEWTEATWNPTTGCTKISPGCKNCYAERFAERWRGIKGHPYEYGFNLRLWDERVDIPLSWKKPRVIFVNSMSDLFHEDVPSSFIARVWQVMADTPQHTYQILTKRPDRMSAVLHEWDFPTLSNVWLGTSIEGPDVFDRLNHLRSTPAAIRFVSFEPLIASVRNADLSDISWAIVGGESGPRARPMRPEWVDVVELLCQENGVAFFFKQWGGVRKDRTGRKRRGRTYNAMPLQP